MANGNEQRAREAARQFREEQNLGVQPISDLVSVIQQGCGCDVAIIDAPEDEHGLIARDPERNVTYIGVATMPHPMRQRSTLAHELAHVIFRDKTESFTQRDAAEIRADAFARHVLAPVEGVKMLLGRNNDVDEGALSAVVQHYLVSPGIAAIVMRDAGYIDEAWYAQWRKLSTPALATRYGWRDRYEALAAESRQPRAPQRLLARATTGYVEGVVSLQTLATLKGKPVEAVKAELDAAHIVRRITDPAAFEVEDLSPVDVDLSALDESGE